MLENKLTIVYVRIIDTITNITFLNIDELNNNTTLTFLSIIAQK